MATMRVMQRRSPVDLTLADVAKEAGVVPATLIQRFGTKRGLLLAACRTAPGGVPEQFGAARAKYGSPLKSLIELYAECSGFASTPEAMANGLAYLQVDLIDPTPSPWRNSPPSATKPRNSSMMPWRPTNSSPATPAIWPG
jgi:AcrR family transcriptional regulator